jgi:5'-nucleotidase
MSDDPLQPPPADQTEPPSVPPSKSAQTPLHRQLLDALGRATPQLEPPHSRRIFVHRNLMMDQVEVIGFDMDYTLALYNQPRLEQLSVQCTLRKMIEQRGYPQALLTLPYDPQFAIRGLVVDREHGNLLKMDRYHYVGRGYHGTRPLNRQERHRLYHTQPSRLHPSRFAQIDTLFALPETVLYAQAVDFFDRSEAELPLTPAARMARYSQLWADIRESIDEAHRDESIKHIIKADMKSYIEQDADLPLTLQRFRSAGKRLFLLTNSGFDYTQAVMSYLLDDRLPDYPSWRDYFDVIVVDARKPTFFTQTAPLVALDPSGQPLSTPRVGVNRGDVFSGGNAQALEELLGMRGDRLLYVGDHIYGDMYKAKRSSVWRTAMVIQELEEELERHARVETKLQRLEVLERRRNRIDGEVRYQQMLLGKLYDLVASDPQVLTLRGTFDLDTARREAETELKQILAELQAAHRQTDADIDRLEHDIEHAFNPFWGPLFKAGAENSRFGEQVEDFVCLYTSRVSNFLSYSPFQYFRSPREHLPHERVY